MDFSDSAFDARPLHMRHVVAILHYAAEIELQMAHLLYMLRPEAAAAVGKLLSTANNATKKYQTFEALTAVFLTPDQKTLWTSIVRKVEAVLKQRHAFAHSRFGWSPTDERYLLLFGARENVIHGATMMDPGGIDVASASLQNLIEAYTLLELEVVVARIRHANNALFRFRKLVSAEAGGHDTSVIRALLDADLSEF